MADSFIPSARDVIRLASKDEDLLSVVRILAINSTFKQQKQVKVSANITGEDKIYYQKPNQN